MGPILMTEDGKKPGIEGAGHPDPLSATGMFLNAFQPQPDQPVEPQQESAGEWFAAEDKSRAALGGAKLGGPWGQPLNAPSVPSPVARPSLGEGKPVPGEFTQMFHKLEFAPSPPASSAPEARPSPEIARQEPGEFTRMFVRATASMPQRPMPAVSDPAAFAPPATPRLKGFSTPGVSDSASPEGSFTQLFQTAGPAPAAPVRPFTPLSNGTEAAWSSNLDSPPSKDAMESAGVTQLFRALSPENEPPANRFGEQSPQPAVPVANAPSSITMLIQRLTEDLQSSSSPLPASGPEPARVSEPGEFTRIMSGGSASGAAGKGGPAEKVAVPAPAVFPVPAAPLPAPAFAAPAAPAVAGPKLQAPPIPAPPVVASADPPQSKLQQMMPMLLVLNAFLLVVLIVLVVFLLKSR
jgi:hypothetical protein